MSHLGGSNNQNYMDDVPIIMSPKWKIPPLPSITEELVAPFFVIPMRLEQTVPYDFSLEQSTLEKVTEMKIVRSKELSERDMRIRARHEEIRQRLEAEGTKLKEQLTQVSYPSPDEFSSDSDEEDIKQSKKHSKIKSKPVVFNFNSILTPTIISKKEIGAEKNSVELRRMSNKLELADFENDASDPFHSIELRTIDDLDVLAQVLKTSATFHSKVNHAKDNNNKDNKNLDNPDYDEDNDQEFQKINPESSEKSFEKVVLEDEKKLTQSPLSNRYTSASNEPSYIQQARHMTNFS